MSLLYALFLLQRSRHAEHDDVHVFPLSTTFGNVVAHEALVLVRWLARSLRSNAVSPRKRAAYKHYFATECTVAAAEYLFGAPPQQQVHGKVSLSDAELVSMLAPAEFTRVQNDSTGTVRRIVFFYLVRVRWQRRLARTLPLLPFTTLRITLRHLVWQPNLVDFPDATTFPTHGRFIPLDTLSPAQRKAIDTTARPLKDFD